MAWPPESSAVLLIWASSRKSVEDELSVWNFVTTSPEGGASLAAETLCARAAAMRICSSDRPTFLFFVQFVAPRFISGERRRPSIRNRSAERGANADPCWTAARVHIGVRRDVLASATVSRLCRARVGGRILKIAKNVGISMPSGGVPDLPSPRLRAAAAGRHSPLRLQDRL
jgi:hypothetical protein